MSELTTQAELATKLRQAQSDNIRLVEMIEDIVDAGLAPLRQTVEWIRDSQPRYYSKKQASPAELHKFAAQTERLEGSIAELEGLLNVVKERFPHIVPFTEPETTEVGG